ncbi:MAG: septum formation initiator family protein [Oscillospiraceae bacterium]|nr:septum formation initiator family protein [Oscillospiraceae bacterium]
MMKIPGVHTLLKFIIPAVLIYALLNIYQLKEERERGSALLEELRIKAESIEKENERISAEIASAGDDELIAAIARKRFGLVMPDEIVFYGPSD